MRDLLGYELLIALRYLRAKRTNSFLSLITAISVAGVVVGVAALIIVLAVMNGFKEEVQSRIVGTNAHVVVLSYLDSGIEDYPSVVKKILQMPPVLGAAPFVYSKAMIGSEKQADGIIVKGVDLAQERSVTTVVANITPRLETISSGSDSMPPGIVLGSEVALRLRVTRGETVVLAIPTLVKGGGFGTIPRMMRFNVEGVFNSGMYEFDSSLGFVSLQAAQRLFKMGDRVTGIEVKIRDMYDAPAIADSIVAGLGGVPFRANNWIELNSNLFAWMKMEKTVMFLILALIVLVAAFNIVATLVMSVLEKRKDIGILKSLGATSRGVMKVFMWQGVVIGVLGTALGTLLGVVLTGLLDKYKFISLPGDIYFIETLPVRLELMDILLVALAAIGASFLATLYPSWQASRLLPVDAIRYE